jgi:hypothetical protein
MDDDFLIMKEPDQRIIESWRAIATRADGPVRITVERAHLADLMDSYDRIIAKLKENN